MLRLTRTASDNPDFRALVQLLDHDLRERNGPDHAFYAQFNKVDKIKHVVVAYQHDEPVGCGAIKEFTAELMEVKRMFVHPSWRGQGIAPAVLAELERWAQELHYKGCVLETGMKQLEAIRLYQKSGYQRIPNYGQYVGVENSVCMQKELT
ncbi:GCN5-related N-acetyltransferase [Hymenobacter roseosalivarius DSM 11622]|uniref:GCN5-related N-acetyltransferase n=1 Tax=Hymenobacter roseosalivarius DSM 11622 TaxID=645990 RepID=A0A1W1URG7_9BACT|nr:GNAT family N-acetyltransferase [Hymenobacter roseosalivarius]SMB83687.1 GCN5-related N-acetyltransferase [Hymenobacter roseosalivarius DSM 11622]